MRNTPNCLLMVGLLTCCGQPRRDDGSALSNNAPRLSCARPDSLERAALWYSDAIIGVRGMTEGGTRVAVYPEGPAWRLMIEPVFSENPSTGDTATGWPYGADPETLQIVWREAARGAGAVFPRDTGSSAGWVREQVDSIVLSIRCDTLVLAPWGERRHGQPLLLDRRLDPAY